jgi:hypothetical protein
MARAKEQRQQQPHAKFVPCRPDTAQLWHIIGRKLASDIGQRYFQGNTNALSGKWVSVS